MKEAFSIFDRDGDGKISSKEIGCVLKRLGYCPTKQQLEKIIRKVDLDGKSCSYFELSCMKVGL